ncbi:MAG: hypothetical protein ACRBF0_24700 [Calditrichia bacterium]
MMRFFRNLTVLITCLVIVGCEADRFLGYQYAAEPLAEFVGVSGKVVNTFDRSEVVFEAMVSFEGQSAATDRQGDFQLDYALTGDEQFDRPINVRIEQEKYYTLDTTLVVRDGVSGVVWPMVYGSPRIASSVRDSLTYTTTIFDYQGEQTISKVQCAVYFRDGDDDDTQLFLDMERIDTVDANTAVYRQTFPQTTFINGEPVYIITKRGHQIDAEDVDGFTESIYFVEEGATE